MTESEVERAIVEVLTEIQTRSGEPRPSIIAETCPLKDLPHFDSHLALLATVELAAMLGCEIPDDVNVFINDKGNRPRRVREITEQLCGMIKVKVTTHER